MKRRRLNCNPVQFQLLQVYTGLHSSFYTQYNDYYLGDRLTRDDKKLAHIDLTTQSVVIGNLSTTNRALRAAKALQQFTIGSSSFYYRKLRFTGKGYKVKKFRLQKCFKLFFGHSHLQYIYAGGLRYKKLSKYRLLLITNKRKKLNRIVSLSLAARPINRYTKRGFRCTRQFILKRPGKKSNY